MRAIIFTDLDGTLLHHYTYDFAAARPLLAELARRHIPVIPATSKTRREVEDLLAELDIRGPFVVENGSAIGWWGERDSGPFALGDREFPIRLGCDYDCARAGLRSLALELGVSLCGFGDLDDEGVANATGLPLEAARRAKAREFSEPFLAPEGLELAQLAATAARLDFRVLAGGRFYHLIGAEAGKGRAARWLVDRLATGPHRPLTVGLGDSPNDLELLEAVDRPIVVPGKTGHPHPQLRDRGWAIAPDVAPDGWVWGVKHALESLLS